MPACATSQFTGMANIHDVGLFLNENRVLLPPRICDVNGGNDRPTRTTRNPFVCVHKIPTDNLVLYIKCTCVFCSAVCVVCCLFVHPTHCSTRHAQHITVIRLSASLHNICAPLYYIVKYIFIRQEALYHSAIVIVVLALKQR